MSADTIAHQQHSNAIDVFGFWLYIMTDCVLFGALFAAFVVLHQPGSYGPALKSLIDLHYVLAETTCLLLSNLSFGLAIMASYQGNTQKTNLWLLMTCLLGGCFVAMEIHEFIHLAHAGYRWDVSAAASAFFTLVGTHGLHVSFGLLWMLVIIAQVFRFGLNDTLHRRLTYLGIFWNFLDIVWIFVFTIVYLFGAL